MSVYYRTKGFVLAKNDFKESDQFFDVYTEDYGKVEILGKAIRKIKSKLRPGMDVLYFSEVEFIQGKNHKTLTDAVVLKKFKGARADLKKLRAGLKILETADKLIQGQEKDERIFSLLAKTLYLLEQEDFSSYTREILYYYYFFNLISLLGYRIDLYNCSVCQKKLVPESLFFNREECGIICQECAKLEKEKIEIFPETIKIIRFFLRGDWDIVRRLKIEQVYLDQISCIFERYPSHIFGKTIVL